MPSDNVGAKRKDTNDSEIPAELSKREAQDRAKGNEAESPVDAQHVDAPPRRQTKHQPDTTRDR
jgi:hypothetical protein